jgi:hypothetical protein
VSQNEFILRPAAVTAWDLIFPSFGLLQRGLKILCIHPSNNLIRRDNIAVGGKHFVDASRRLCHRPSQRLGCVRAACLPASKGFGVAACCPGSFVQMLLDFLLGAKPILFRSSDWAAALLPILVRQARNLLVFWIGLPDLFFNCAFRFLKVAFNLILRAWFHLSSPYRCR